MKICVLVHFKVVQSLFGFFFFTVSIVEWTDFGDKYFLYSMWLKGICFWVCLGGFIFNEFLPYCSWIFWKDSTKAKPYVEASEFFFKMGFELSC